MTWILRRLIAGLMIASAIAAIVWTNTPSIRFIPLVMSITGTFLIVHGVRLFRKKGSLKDHFFSTQPWGFLAISMLLSSLVTLPLLNQSFHQHHSGWIEVISYALVSILNLGGLVLILRDRFGQQQLRERVSESALLTTSLTFAAWLFFEWRVLSNGNQLKMLGILGAASSITPHTYSEAVRLAIMALPDVFALVVAGQILASYRSQPLSYRFLFLGTAAKAFGTLSFLLLHDYLAEHGIFAFEATIFYVGFYTLAALHPSMARHDEQSQISLERSTRWRFIFVVVSVFAGPALTGILVTTREHLSITSIIIGTSVLPLFITMHVLSLIRTGTASEHQARHDDLTGLPNRILLGARIEAALATAANSGSPVALLYIDLDRFKTVNDSLGHAAGNTLLQQVASRLKACVDGDISVSRLSGDEFAILIPQTRSEREPIHLCEQILASFRSPIDLSRRQQVFITPSIGVAYSDEHANTPEAILANADTALYQAKDRGRNRFEVFESDMNARAQRRLTLEAALRGAIERNEFVLHYQPKVNLVSGHIIGVEALIRWNHPEFGMLGPMEFINIAEDTGLIGPLGEWVMYEACRQAKRWVDIDFPKVTVAVNLSPRQFQVSTIADVVAKALRTTGLDASLLELEITESLAFYGEDRAIEVLEEIHDLGVSCSIDDFGTGYSSLSYLARFPIDRLKIDKSFIKQITDKGEAPLVTAIIAMAHSLGLEVVAEGVERRDQVLFLQKHGCDQIQGHLFSRALPPDEVETLIMLEHVAPGQGRLSLPRMNVNEVDRFGTNTPSREEPQYFQDPIAAPAITSKAEVEEHLEASDPSAASGKYGHK